MEIGKIGFTSFPPQHKPVMIWDGNCGFCLYWKTYWEEMSNGKISFLKLQQAGNVFPDIDPLVFKKSVCLIEISGEVHTGAAAVFRSFDIFEKHLYLYSTYQNSRLFRKISEGVYRLIADHRNSLMQLTYILFGRDPLNLKKYWIIYLLLLLAFLLWVMNAL